MKEKVIASQLDAILAMRELRKNNNDMRLDPCDRPEDASNTCRLKDPNGTTLCLHKDGLLIEGNDVLCPRQWGKLQVVPKNTTEK